MTLAPHGSSKCHCCINFLKGLDQDPIFEKLMLQHNPLWLLCHFPVCGGPHLHLAPWGTSAFNLRTRVHMVGPKMKGHEELLNLDPGRVSECVVVQWEVFAFDLLLSVLGVLLFYESCAFHIFEYFGHHL